MTDLPANVINAIVQIAKRCAGISGFFAQPFDHLAKSISVSDQIRGEVHPFPRRLVHRHSIGSDLRHDLGGATRRLI